MVDKFYFKYLTNKKGDSTLKAIAPHLGMSYNALNERLHGKVEFRVSDVMKFKEYYEVSNEDMCKCFFSHEVSND